MASQRLSLFPEHPAKFLRPGKEPPLLMDAEAKSEVFCSMHGADYRGVSGPSTSPLPMSLREDFLAYLKDNLSSLHCVCVGENFHFGKDRMGDADYLRKNGDRYGLKVCVADGILDGDEPISSSRIRESPGCWPDQGGQPHARLFVLCFCGTVWRKVRGLGSEIGFPTLNLPLAFPRLVPLTASIWSRLPSPPRIVSAPKLAVANYGCSSDGRRRVMFQPLLGSAPPRRGG